MINNHCQTTFEWFGVDLCRQTCKKSLNFLNRHFHARQKCRQKAYKLKLRQIATNMHFSAFLWLWKLHYWRTGGNKTMQSSPLLSNTYQMGKSIPITLLKKWGKWNNTQFPHYKVIPIKLGNQFLLHYKRTGEIKQC